MFDRLMHSAKLCTYDRNKTHLFLLHSLQLDTGVRSGAYNWKLKEIKMDVSTVTVVFLVVLKIK